MLSGARLRVLYHSTSAQAHLRDDAPQCGDVRFGSAEDIGTQICGDDPTICEGVRSKGFEGFSEDQAIYDTKIIFDSKATISIANRTKTLLYQGIYQSKHFDTCGQ